MHTLFSLSLSLALSLISLKSPFLFGGGGRERAGCLGGEASPPPPSTVWNADSFPLTTWASKPLNYHVPGLGPARVTATDCNFFYTIQSYNYCTAPPPSPPPGQNCWQYIKDLFSQHSMRCVDSENVTSTSFRTLIIEAVHTFHSLRADLSSYIAEDESSIGVTVAAAYMHPLHVCRYALHLLASCFTYRSQ